MRTIDRYIIAKFVKSFFLTIFLFTLVATAIDFSEKIDNFIEKSIPVKEVILDYYIHFVPHIAALLAPLFLLISVVYFTSKLAYRNEFVTSVSGGISFYRLLVPYIICALFFSGAMYAVNHKILPQSNKARVDFEERRLRKKLPELQHDLHRFIDPSTSMYFQQWNSYDRSAVSFSLEKFQDHRLVWKLSSTKASIIEDVNEGEARWKIQNYLIRSLGDDGKMTMRRGTFKEPYLDTILPITEKTFMTLPSTRETMTSAELNDFIQIVEESGAGGGSYWSYETHRRSASAFSMLIMTVMGFSIASRKQRGGIGIHLAGAVVVAVAYVFLNKFSETWTLGYSLNPMIGAWLPNVLFAGIAWLMIWRAQK